MEPMDLQLVINEVAFQLSDPIMEQKLAKANFQKPNILKKLVRKFPLSQKLYESDNCTLTCFNEKFLLYPMTDSYLNQDRQWETSARLAFKNGHLGGVFFQVINGHYAAHSFMDRFQESCTEQFGEPQERNRFRIAWKSESDTITCIMHRDGINADFFWKLISKSK